MKTKTKQPLTPCIHMLSYETRMHKFWSEDFYCFVKITWLNSFQNFTWNFFCFAFNKKFWLNNSKDGCSFTSVPSREVIAPLVFVDPLSLRVSIEREWVRHTHSSCWMKKKPDIGGDRHPLLLSLVRVRTCTSPPNVDLFLFLGHIASHRIASHHICLMGKHGMAIAPLSLSLSVHPSIRLVASEW